MTKSTQAYIDAVIAAGAATIASAVLDWRSDSLVHYSVFLFLFVAGRYLEVPCAWSDRDLFSGVLLRSARIGYIVVFGSSGCLGISWNRSVHFQDGAAPFCDSGLLQRCESGSQCLCGLPDYPAADSGAGGATAYDLTDSGGFGCVFCKHRSCFRGAHAGRTRGSLAEVWKHWCLGSLPYYIVGAMIVAATISAQNRVSTVAAILIAPSILLTTMYYRFWLRPAVEQPIQSQEMSHGS